MIVALIAGVGVLGGIGAIARFLLDGAVSARAGRGLAWGTFAVNVSGAFVLGVLVGAALSGDAYRLAGTGLLGAYTTFSTWMFESHRLAEDGEARLAAVNIVASIVAGLLAVWLGRELGAAL